MTAGDFYARMEAARLPPVRNWNPPLCGDSGMRIARDGQSFHAGKRITRPELVRLFCGLLRKEGADYVLVTPAEKLSIAVEDAPFLAVALEQAGEDLLFTTNAGDAVRLGPGHGLRLQDDVPYLHVRGGLEAKVARNVWYQLAALAAAQGDRMGVISGGEFFVLGPAA